jgi:hypothetical protein
MARSRRLRCRRVQVAMKTAIDQFKQSNGRNVSEPGRGNLPGKFFEKGEQTMYRDHS